MDVEETLYTVLSTAPELAGLAVRPDVAMISDTAPYIVYKLISGKRVNSLAGDSGLANPYYQIDVYAKDPASRASLKKAVRIAVLGNLSLGAVHIDEGSDYEIDTKLFRSRQDFSIWFND
ncbi:MAG: DUF3168 domain-containing protein [Undibacterium umbellatum]|uniref:tail completion protein gp17 n=1 Tax=Undibacterium umbellatum TaxID=2762300 RepID=UPI003BB7A85B